MQQIHLPFAVVCHQSCCCVYTDTQLSFTTHPAPSQLPESLGSLDPFCLLVSGGRTEHNDLTVMQTLQLEAFLDVSCSEACFMFGNPIFRTEYK